MSLTFLSIPCRSNLHRKLFRSVSYSLKINKEVSTQILDFWKSADSNARKEKLIHLINSVKHSDVIIHNLNKLPGGIKIGMALKEDLTELLKSEAKQLNATCDKEILSSCDNALKNWIANVFCYDTIELKTVTFESASGIILEKVAKGEAVHRVRSLSELKRRLHDGRKCFALFHESLPDDPIAFLHVAFTPALAGSLRYLNSIQSSNATPTHAMFYSVNSPIPVLSGLDLALRVIKNATESIRHEHPSVHTMSTLSPIPGFMSWLQTMSKLSQDSSVRIEFISNIPVPIKAQLIALHSTFKSSWAALPLPIEHAESASVNSQAAWCAVQWLHNVLSQEVPVWTQNLAFLKDLKPVLLWLGANFVANVKLSRGSSGLPADNVTRFHIRNGACFYRINFMGNDHAGGLSQSAGLMANYLYICSDESTLDVHDREWAKSSVEDRALDFENNGGIVPCSYYISQLLSGTAIECGDEN